MDDKQLMKLCIIIIIIGMAALFVISQTIQPRFMKLSEIDNSIIGQLIETNATIKSVYVKDGHVFLDLKDGYSEINGVMFESDAKKQPGVYNLKKNDNISVVGEVNNYKGELEIVIRNIKRV